MYIQENKKAFLEPVCEIISFSVEDILTESSGSEGDWDLGEF